MLHVFGLFQDPWPPPSMNDTTSMEMIDWEIRVENEGKKVKSISCIGEGAFEVDVPMIIVVERTN